jgi:UDP-glucose 4-epimerase
MRLLEFCRKYGVKKVVVLSTAHLYGALPDNHAFIEEDDPIRAEQEYSALHQVIEVDTYVRSWMYRYKDVKAVIFRPCNIVGPTITNSMVQYLTRDFSPTLFGFDPVMQFIHEDDLTEAVAMAVEKEDVSGVFNIAGPGVIPLSKAIKEAGGKVLPIPHPLVYLSINVLWSLGLSLFPSPEVDYLRYPCIVSVERAEKILGFQPQFSLMETLRCLRDRRVFAK